MPGIDLFLVHSVTVETYLGSGAYGDTYADPAPIPCFLDDGVHLTRDRAGAEVASTSTVYAAPGSRAALAPGSRVTVNGRTAFVISVNDRNGGPLGLPDHVEAHLT